MLSDTSLVDEPSFPTIDLMLDPFGPIRSYSSDLFSQDLEVLPLRMLLEYLFDTIATDTRSTLSTFDEKVIFTLV